MPPPAFGASDEGGGSLEDPGSERPKAVHLFRVGDRNVEVHHVCHLSSMEAELHLAGQLGPAVVLHAVMHEGHKLGPEPLVELALLHLSYKVGFGSLELLDLLHVLEATLPSPVPRQEEAVEAVLDVLGV